MQRAACGGHLGACYVLGMVNLICHDGEEFTKCGFGNIKTSLQMLECRRKLERSARYKWRTRKNNFIQPPKLFICPFQDRKRSLWRLYDKHGENNLHCETCILNREMLVVYSMLTGRSFPSYSYSFGMCLSKSVDEDTK